MKFILGILFFTSIANAQLVNQGSNDVYETLDLATASTWSKTFTFKNVGTNSETLTVALTGADASKFSFINRCNVAIAKSKTCQVIINSLRNATPKRVSPYLVSFSTVNISLTVTNSTAPPENDDGPPVVSDFDFTPDTLPLAEFGPGELSKIINLTITNNGTQIETPTVVIDSSGTLGVTFAINRCNVPVDVKKTCSVQLKITNPPSSTVLSRNVRIYMGAVEKDIILVTGAKTNLCVANSYKTCSIANASSATQTCAADGKSYGQCLVQTCASGYYLSNNQCLLITYTSTYSDYIPEVPASQAICDGTVTSNRTIQDCRRNYDNASVASSFCSDAAPTVVSKSPAGAKVVNISNGTETYNCALGSSTEVFSARTCDLGFYNDGLGCSPTQYIATYTLYNPDVPASQEVCDGTVVSTRTIDTCRQQHDNQLVSNNLCSDPTPQVISQSPNGSKFVIITNGSESRSCVLGSPSAYMTIRSCNSGYYDDGDSCELTTYIAEYTAYNPSVPTNLIACDGTITSNRDIATCKQSHDNELVANNLCLDSTPQVITQSPFGSKLISIDHGSESYTCEEGSNVLNFVSRTCESGYYDNNIDSCLPINYIASYSAYIPEIPNNLIACDGTVTSQRTITECKKQHNNEIVDNSLCSDPAATVLTQSPAGLKNVMISNGTEVYSCLEGSSFQSLSSRNCDVDYYNDLSICAPITYVAEFSAYNPLIPTLNACDGTVTSTRSISSCKQQHDNVLVANNKCIDPTPQVITQSPAGPKVVNISNGTETYNCALGSSTQVFSTRTCNSDYFNNGSSCQAITYIATYNPYTPTIPVGQVACDGTVISNRTINDCRQQHDNALVSNNKCSDPTPQVITQSPAGPKVVNISNGTETYNCALGSTTQVFASRSCNSGYFNNGSSCQVITYIATYSAYSPTIPTGLVACDGTITSTRTIVTCKQQHDNASVATNLCSDPNATVFTQSPAGNSTRAITGGTETRSCTSGQSFASGTSISRNCTALDYYDDSTKCQDKWVFYTDTVTGNMIVSDGTSAGTGTLAALGFSPSSLFFLGSYFDNSSRVSVSGNYLYLRDSTGNIYSLKRGEKTATLLQSGLKFSSHTNLGITGFATTNTGKFIFLGNKSPLGDELWVSDGTPAGTFNLANITSGSSSSRLYQGQIISAGAFVYAVIQDTALGTYSIWRTDGTVVGTTQISGTSTADAISGLSYYRSNPYYLRLNTVYKITGTTLSTFKALGGSFAMSRMQSLYDKLVIGRGFDGHGFYMGDDNSANLVAISPANTLYTGAPSGGNTNFAKLGTNWYFATNNNAFGRTQGAVANTVVLQGFNDGNAINSVMHSVNGRIIFAGKLNSNGLGRELWSSDGTTTSLIKDINAGAGDGIPTTFSGVVFNNKLYFTGCVSTTGCELWVTDGTAVGTNAVKDVNPTVTTGGIRIPGLPSYLNYDNSARHDTVGEYMGAIPYKTGFFFLANDQTSTVDADAGKYLYQPYFTDGTAIGTVKIKDLLLPAQTTTVTPSTSYMIKF